MIFFKPHAQPDGEAYFEALEGDVCLGTCRLRFDGGKADVYALSLTDGNAETGEGLLRAAYHFAANRGAYWGLCSAPGAAAVIARLRFDETAVPPQNDIPTLLSGHCKMNGGCS